MYIWILLATIMIALSFFNLSPRPDKESVFTETKALTEITRFRLEHYAFARAAECKMINSVLDKVITEFPESNNDVDLKNWKDNLPIGYALNEADIDGQHIIYCLKGELEHGGSPKLAQTCLNTTENPAFRYAVSFRPVPDRWITKNSGDPIPSLLKAMSKQYVKGTIMGITDCAIGSSEYVDEEGWHHPIEPTFDGCTFYGTESYVKEYNKSEDKKEVIHLSFTPDATDTENRNFFHNLFKNSNFRYTCGGLCFFAVHKLSNKDVGLHCPKIEQADDTGYYHGETLHPLPIDVPFSDDFE